MDCGNKARMHREHQLNQINDDMNTTLKYNSMG